MTRPLLTVLAGAIALIVGVGRIVAARRRNPRRLPLPPGPKGLPLVGTLSGLPREIPWKGWHELCQTYGGMFYFSVFGQGILVLDSYSWANELLEKRAVKYSNRPHAPMLELMDLPSWNFSMMQHGPDWKQHRRAFHQFFNNTAVSQFHPIIYEERDLLLERLEASPERFAHHIETFFGVLIMRTTYGLDNPDETRALINHNLDMLKMFGEANIPGRFMVNVFPFLKHVPGWVPGAGFQSFFDKFREAANKTLHLPYLDAKARLERGESSTHPSLITGILDRRSSVLEKDGPDIEDQERLAKDVCGLTYLAGAETSAASATVLLLVLAEHPEVQKKAQEELDAVVGLDRSPTIGDRSNLPYIQAIVKEIGRWFTVAPLGVPHASAEDDEYEGHFIPQGTIVIPNCWAMMHDPEVFESPFEFKPERYMKDGQLDPSVPDPERAAFGFGRRICPGRFFSNDALFLVAGSLLSTFQLSLPDAQGPFSADLKVNFESGIVAKPESFIVRILRRHPRLYSVS